MSSFSIRWLFLLVAYCALSVTALLNGNDYWRNSLESAAIVLLLAAIVGIIVCVGQRRAFWTGWLVFGTAWFLFAYGAFEFSRAWRSRLVTTAALEALHDGMIRPTTELLTQEEYEIERRRFEALGAQFARGSAGIHVTYAKPSRGNFTGVGNAALGIPFSLLGAMIATWFWRQREAEVSLRPG